MVARKHFKASVRRHACNAAPVDRIRADTPSGTHPSSSKSKSKYKNAHRSKHPEQIKKKLAISRKQAHTKKAPSMRHRRSDALLAEQTVDVVFGDGKYIETRRCRDSSPLANVLGRHAATSLWHVVHDISQDIAYSVANTMLYEHSSTIPNLAAGLETTQFDFTPISPLAAIRRNASKNIINKSGPVLSHIGLLIQTSSRPGGDFTEGSNTFEAVAARATSVMASLSSSKAGQQFYHALDPESILYSPQVIGIRRPDDDQSDIFEPDFNPRRDAIPADPTTSNLEDMTNHRRVGGEHVAPYAMNVLSIPQARWSAVSKTASLQAHKACLRRALAVLASHGNRSIVLRPDPGVPIVDSARVYAELLACQPTEPGIVSLCNVFERVIFSIPRSSICDFRDAFEVRVLEDELESALLDS